MQDAKRSGRASAGTIIGRYVLHAPIARGGMATIYIARLVGAEGFNRIVAVKRLHPQLAEDPEFVAMFLDEARIASRIAHHNVVPVLDVVASGREVMLVQEYVHGVPLNVLLRQARQSGAAMPTSIAIAIATGILAGLNATHESRDDSGARHGIVHRDVSPQNILVTLDGTPKLLDFGIAKASLSSHVTRQGVLKGKVGYMAPEQLTGDVTSATDIYSLGIVLWECLANRRLHQGKNDVQMLGQLLSQSIPPLREVLDSSTLPEARWREIVALDPVVMKALNRVPEERFATAAEMLGALSRVATAAHASDVAAWLRRNGADFLTERNRLLASEESSWRDLQELPTDLPDAGSEPSARSGARVAAAAERKPVSPMSPQTARRLLVGGSLLLLLVAMAFLAIVVLVVRRSPSPEGGASLPSVPSAGPPAMVSTIGSFPSAAVSIPAGIVTAGAPSVLSNAKPVPPPMEAPNPSIPSQPTLFWHRPPDGSPSTSATAPPTTLSTAPVATSATAPANCSPPFYFEGRKKVFKPSCL